MHKARKRKTLDSRKEASNSNSRKARVLGARRYFFSLLARGPLSGLNMALKLDFLYDGLSSHTGPADSIVGSSANIGADASALFEDKSFMLPRVNDVSAHLNWISTTI